MIYNILAVFIGGGIGAVLRYLVSCLGGYFFQMPLGATLAVNLAGCILIGYVFGLTLDRVQTIPLVLKLFITVGFLGGLTTFSTFSLESFELIKNGKVAFALLYMAASCVLSIVLVFLGYYLGKQ